MKKLILILFILLASVCSAQKYSSLSVETMDALGNTLSVDKCDFRFNVDTAGRVVTCTDIEHNKIQIIFLTHLSDHILTGKYLKTWGYDVVRSYKTLKALSFSESLSGKLLYINFYSITGKILTFSINQIEKL